MTRRRRTSRGADALFRAALRKTFLAERLTLAEARELRRRRLPDGAIPVPRTDDAKQRLPFQHFDPRIA